MSQVELESEAAVDDALQPESGADRRSWVLSALEAYETRLTRYAQRIAGGDLHLARDVVQHAFLRLCDQSPDSVRDVAAWLYAVCRHRALDLRRGSARWEPLAGSDPAVADHRADDPALASERRDSDRQLREVLATLSDSQREVIALWSEGFGYREISQITGHTESYVRVLAHRALKEIREHPTIRKLLQDN
jgi:RNA polymerase sigma-70 factor (ECF subfamily)